MCVCMRVCVCVYGRIIRMKYKDKENRENTVKKYAHDVKGRLLFYPPPPFLIQLRSLPLNSTLSCFLQLTPSSLVFALDTCHRFLRWPGRLSVMRRGVRRGRGREETVDVDVDVADVIVDVAIAGAKFFSFFLLHLVC